VTRSLALGLSVGALAGLAAGFIAGRLSVERPEHKPLVIYRESTLASSGDTRDTGTRSARHRVTPDEPRTDPPGRAAASAVPVAPPKPVSAAPSRPKPKGTPWEEWTEAQFIDALERAARGDRIEYSHNVLTHLRRRFPNARVSLALATALIEAGENFNASLAARTFTSGELRTALERATRATPNDRASWFLAQAAAGLAGARGVVVDDTLRRDLLAHEMPHVRFAGLRVAYAEPGAQRDQIRRIGASDPNPGTRAFAIDVLMTSESGMDTEAPALLLDALENGTTELRSNLLHLVPLIGPDSGRHALRLLVDEGYAAGGEEVTPLIEAVMMGGLTGNLLAARPSPEVIRIVAEFMSSALETDPSLAASFEPHLPAIAAALGDDALESFYDDAAAMGFTAWVVHDASSSSHSAAGRLHAFYAARDGAGEDDPTPPWFVDLARALIWDDSAGVVLRKEALQSLQVGRELSASTIPDQLRILRDHTTPPGLRLHVLRTITDSLGDEEREQRAAEFKAVLRDVAKNDPSAWVRGEAEDRLREEWPDEDP